MPLAVVLPGGRRIGSRDARVTLRLNDLAPLALIATGQIGRVAQDYVEGRLDFDGSVRDLMAGSAMSFEQGWISLFQMLASRPDGDVAHAALRGAQSRFPFNREYIYR